MTRWFFGAEPFLTTILEDGDRENEFWAASAVKTEVTHYVQVQCLVLWSCWTPVVVCTDPHPHQSTPVAQAGLLQTPWAFQPPSLWNEVTAMWQDASHHWVLQGAPGGCWPTQTYFKTHANILVVVPKQKEPLGWCNSDRLSMLCCFQTDVHSQFLLHFFF